MDQKNDDKARNYSSTISSERTPTDLNNLMNSYHPLGRHSVASIPAGHHGMDFLSAVKTVQRVQRMDKRVQQRGRQGNFLQRALSERIPLVQQQPVRSDLEKVNQDERNEDTIPPVNVKESIGAAIFGYVFGKGIVSAFLLAMPFALVAVYQQWSATWIFWLNFFVMIPLASILGDFTEEVALHTNQTIGGLINATFGNAVEVVVAVQALLANEIRVVQASMLGSIFSNLLLVLGCCFFFGGLRFKEQHFNATAATANMGLLALSSIALILPTPISEYYELHDPHVLIVSRLAAIFLLFMYIQLLYFQLKTHAHIFDDADAEQELATLPFWVACVGLLVVTLLVTLFSEYLVGSIEGFTQDSGISRTFVGIIILPIVGNAVEHVTAVTVAMKNKMDLAMGVAVGSCTQISLFVVPFTVLVGWISDKDMNLNFPHFEVILYVMSVLTVSIVVSTPTSNWLEGSLLCNVYLFIAIGFWFENVKKF